MQTMFRSLSVVTVWMGLLACQSPAGFIVSVVNNSLMESSTGTVDVLINSDANDRLSTATFQLKIEKLGSTATELRFASAQPDSQLIDGSYMFSGGSLKRDGDAVFAIAPEAVGAVSTGGYTNDTFTGTDSSVPLVPVSFVTLTSSNRLLARLVLTPGPGLLAPLAGDQFRVSIVPAFTSFQDDNFTNVSFTSTAGTISIVGVPEPSSLGLVMLSLPALGYWFKRRRSLTH